MMKDAIFALGDLSLVGHSPQRACVNVHVVNTFLFSSWDKRELLLCRSSQPFGGELFIMLKIKVVYLKF